MAQIINDYTDGHTIQGLVVFSCSKTTSTNQLIQNILSHSNKLSVESESDQYKPKTLNLGTDYYINCFDLKVDNKYYSANISLFELKDRQLLTESFVDYVNGVIVGFDSNEESSFDDLKTWIPFVNQYNNEIKLLICQTIDNKCGLKRETIEKWCLENEFELIEICPQTYDNNTDDYDYDNQFKDIDGMTRLLQAIEAHHWPQSTLKERPQYNPSEHFKQLIEKEGFSFNDSDKQNKQNVDLLDQLEPSQHSFDEFSNLFDKFNQMKVKSSQINETERKLYAEKVTIAFWNAIGGDLNEIDGLDDEDIDI